MIAHYYTFDDKDARLGGQDETVIGPRVAADDLVVEIRIEALRLPRLRTFDHINELLV